MCGKWARKNYLMHHSTRKAAAARRAEAEALGRQEKAQGARAESARARRQQLEQDLVRVKQAQQGGDGARDADGLERQQEQLAEQRRQLQRDQHQARTHRQELVRQQENLEKTKLALMRGTAAPAQLRST